MKKKGFTLVELLAVIVILAIIALIAIPLIGNVIEKTKIGALESSVNGLVESANMYYANETIKGETLSETVFDFEDGVQVSNKKLEYKGKVYNGKLILHANGEVAVCIDDEEHYAYKNKDNYEIVSGVGTCLYDGTTGDFSSNSSINDLRGKTLVATDVSQSADGLNALIKVPEEGHYNESSIISVPIETLNTNLSMSKLFYWYGSTYNNFSTDFTLVNTHGNNLSVTTRSDDIYFTMSGKNDGLNPKAFIQFSSKIDVTNLKQLVILGRNQTTATSYTSILYGGISKTAGLTTFSSMEKYTQNNSVNSNAILIIDVSDLEGEYYLYTGLEYTYAGATYYGYGNCYAILGV